ncbi:hypothetical protein H6F38_23175 [Paenibacillus sp. EKM208P]|nr:hypothetical protein H6F38_23175 [Paenibacillus sp. EKM208P]
MIQLDPTNPHHVEWFEEKSGLERMKEIARRAMAEGNFTINDLDKALMELRLEEHRKNMTEEKKTQAIRAGGSLKTIHNIDAQAICRELRGKV